MPVGLDSPDVDQQSSTSQKICPHWHVLLLNDDYHTFGFVIYVMTTIFRKPFPEAAGLTLQIHEEGQAIVATCSKERAQLYEEQVASMKEGEKGAIGCCIEPAE